MVISGLSRGLSTCCLRFMSGVAVIHARLASGWLARLYREAHVIAVIARTRRSALGASDRAGIRLQWNRLHGSCLLTAGCHGPAVAEATRRGEFSEIPVFPAFVKTVRSIRLGSQYSAQ
jgi:hypothetical protein